MNATGFIKRHRAARPGDHLHDVLRGGSLALVLKVVGAGLAFVFNVLLGRFLGPTGAGQFYIALTLVMAASVVAQLGFDTFFLQRSAILHESSDSTDDTSDVFDVGMRMSMLLSLALAVGLFAGSRWISVSLFHQRDLLPILRVMALAVVPLSAANLRAQVLKGIRRPGLGVTFESVAVPGLAIVFLAVSWPFVKGALGAGGSYAGAALVTLVASVFVMKKFAPRVLRPEERRPRQLWRQSLLKVATPFLAVDVIDLVMSWSGIAIVGALSGASEAGVYAAAWRTTLLMAWVLTAANTVAGPKFAALFVKGDKSSIQVVARGVGKTGALLVIPMFAAAVVAPTTILNLFGRGFSVGAPVLVVLALGQVVNVATGPSGYVLLMTGHEHALR